MRSPHRVARPAEPALPDVAAHPPLLMLAAVALAVEAAGLCVAGVLTAVDTAAGRSSQVSSGVALTVLLFIAVAGMAAIASGVYRARPWSRTPAVMAQACAAIVAIYLLVAHRFDWGIPALLLAVAVLAGLLSPPSLRALNRTISRP